MLAVIFLFEFFNAGSLLGFVPESVGLLVFGVILFASAAGLRRIFRESEGRKNIHQTAASGHQSTDF